MKEYIVTLSHNEVINIEANTENEAIHKAYNLADYQGVWDEVEIEEIEDEDDE